ncbi:MAG: hypothetical protein ABI282_02250 [Candidatus Baltobacteraceae bacterium]
MKRSILMTLALAATFVAPLGASAATTGGTVCGRVDANTPLLVALLVDPLQSGTVIAHSATEDVQTTIGNGGKYCFKGLHADLHTIVAFGDASTYSASITPIDGKTLLLDLNAKT